MHPAHERKLLQQLLKEIDAPGKASSWLGDIPVFIAVAVIVVSCFYQFGTPSWPHTLLMAALFAFGMVFSHVLIRRKSRSNWPAFRRLFNREQIESRLRELEQVETGG